MSVHPLQWQSPQPLWARFGANAAAAASADDQSRPAILRFASDEFMEQILGTLARDPAQLDRLLARPETWRTPAADGADLMERVPVPGAVQAALRLGAAKKPKSKVTAVPSAALVKEQVLERTLPLKLYQPAHQRYYLVGASFVCGLPGLPERAVVPGAAEQVNFVVRRLLPPSVNAPTTADRHEFAYLKDASGARWQRVGDDPSRLAPGEELLPVFPLVYRDDAQRERTLWTGMVPVGRREEYFAAGLEYTPVTTFAAGQRQSVLPAGARAVEPTRQARLAQLKLEVGEPWKNLIRSSYKARDSVNTATSSGLSGGETNVDKRKRVFDFNLQQQMASWLILLDFADYLATYLPDVWGVIKNDGAGATSLPQLRRELHTWLAGATMSAGLENALLQPVSDVSSLPEPPVTRRLKDPAPSLAAALKRIVGARAGLERAEIMYDASNSSQDSTDWPDFHYQLGGLERTGTQIRPFDPFSILPTNNPPTPDELETAPGSPLSTEQQASEDAAAKVDLLVAKVVRALEPDAESNAPPPPFAAQVAQAMKMAPGDPGRFVVRFVYNRRDCGPLHPPTVSAPTQEFQLASFFDPDAPARPIRISLPLDTTPAGLRKHNRGTAFVISDILCGQIQRAKGLGFIDLVLAVLPWPLHKDLPTGSTGPCSSGGTNIGMICSLSIPIITICALILLTIIVTLLDMIFRWLPWFIVCFPVLKLMGKKT